MADKPPAVLELRVHGVSGTPPHSTLGVDEGDVEQKAGSDLTGFYQAKPGVKTTGPELPDGAEREAYAWGPLTSGARGLLGWIRRALWLTLLPFALVNVAMWSRHGLSKPTRRTKLAGGLVLLAGLLLTALLVSTIAGIGVDFLAWQCFRDGVPSCPALPSWTEFLASDRFDDPGRRMAVGQVLPLAALAGLWLLTKTAIQRYESFDPPGGRALGPAEKGDPPILARPDMWRGEQRTLISARLHLSLGFAFVIWSTAWPMEALFRSNAVKASDDAVGQALASLHLFKVWGLLALVIALSVIVAAAWSMKEQVTEGPGAEKVPARRMSRFLLIAAWTLLVVHTLLLCWPTGALTDPKLSGAVEPGESLIGVGALPTTLVLALFFVVAALFLISRAARGLLLLVAAVSGLFIAYLTTQDGRAARSLWLLGILLVAGFMGWLWHTRSATRKQKSLAWRGSAPAVLVGAAVAVAILFSTGVTLLVADRLNGDPPASELKDEYERPPTPDAVRLAPDAVLEQGSIQISRDEDGKDIVVIHRGVLRSDTLDAEDGDIRTTLQSRILDNEPVIRIPDGVLRLADSCLTRSGESRRLESAVLQLAPVKGEDYAEVTVEDESYPEACGNLLSAPVRAIASTTPPVLTVPQPYLWFAFALPSFLLIALFIVAFLWSRFRRCAGKRIDDLTQFELGEDRWFRAKNARRRAAFAHRAEGLVSALTVPVLIASLTITVGTLSGVKSIGETTEILAFLGWLVDLGMYLSVALALLLIGLCARMRTSDGTRRSVGVIWDLTTFWPRTAHPFGPPCYAERVVPEVTARARWVLKSGGRVVFSGHSQGSVILVAVLMRLDPKEIENSRFVSYGSQLRAWFGRIFPDALGPDQLGYEPTTGRPKFGKARPDVPQCWKCWSERGDTGVPDERRGGRLCGRHAPLRQVTGGHDVQPDSLAFRLGKDGDVPRWRSLFRRSDPLGFRVHRDVDCYNPVDVPVMEMPVREPGDPAPQVQTHSNYPNTDEYKMVVAPWLDIKVRPRRSEQ